MLTIVNEWSLLTIVNEGLSVTMVNAGLSVTMVNAGLSVTMVNTGLSLTIVNIMTNFFKTVVFEEKNLMQLYQMSSYMKVKSCGGAITSQYFL